MMTKENLMNINVQESESVVFIAGEPHRLRYRPIVEGSLRLCSKASSKDMDHLWYTEGKDFSVDYDNGTIQRSEASPIPDWSRHALFGKSEFNHSDYSDYSNRAYTLYADYQYHHPNAAANAASGELVSNELFRLRKKLENGKAITYVVFGDSISTGAEASEEANKYYNRFAKILRERFPHALIDVRMKAVGGESSKGALNRLRADVVLQTPDLVTIGYGMNDQNKQDYGNNAISLEEYGRNIAKMIEDVQQYTDADIILITPCLPNPLWKYASTNVTAYAETLRELGSKYRIGVADLQRIWLEELSAGKTHESLLLNNVNHPNDYGHRLYAKALECLLVEALPKSIK
jgi:lysophospholipase L1-like esterase